MLETLVAHDFTHLDVSVPLSQFSGFIAAAAPLTHSAGLRPLLVGHLGDGNVHYAVVGQGGQAPDPARLAGFMDDLTDLLLVHGGSFSAEHGIGRSKTAVLAAHKDPAQLAAMRAIKAALDPEGLFNPGVLFGE